MGGPAEFKEKTFEKYFGNELARLTNFTFSPDQCDERFLGFDETFRVPLFFLQNQLPYIRNSRWRRMVGVSLKDIDFQVSNINKRLPNFKFNLFVQYKRPNYVDHFNGKEWACWGRPYFRFDVTPHQQEVLEQVDAQSHGRASVVYASAAFWKNDDLYEFCAAEEVVANSNIANVALLANHGRYTYDRPGTFGIGHSEPESLESKSINRILDEARDQKGLPFTTHIKRAAADLELALSNEPALMERMDLVRRANFGDLFDELDGEYGSSFLYALSTIKAFSELYQLTFYAMALE